ASGCAVDSAGQSLTMDHRGEDGRHHGGPNESACHGLIMSRTRFVIVLSFLLSRSWIVYFCTSGSVVSFTMSSNLLSAASSLRLLSASTTDCRMLRLSTLS